MPALLPLALALRGAPVLPSACSVMTKTEAQAYLGSAVSRVIPEEPKPDEETGALHTTCTFMGAGRVLMISLAEFKSADAAQKKMTAEYLKAQGPGEEDEPPPTVEPESGLGDLAYYGQSAHSAMIIMLKGAHAYSAILGGTPPKPGDRAALRKLVTTLAGKSRPGAQGATVWISTREG
jgi:hypothetical protein